MKDKTRQINLLCPICGNDQFSSPDLDDVDLLAAASDETRIQCSDCKAIFTKAQFIEENQEIINANLEDFKEELVKDVEKDLKRKLKKRFK